MDHLMVGIVAITKDLRMQRPRLIHSITMAIITRAMGTIMGCLIATTMDTTRGLLNLKLILMRSIMDIIQRALGEVMACPIAETMSMTRGLLNLKLILMRSIMDII